MPRFKQQAVCIRLIDWSETSQIVALLTEELGQVRGIAKGAKRLSPSAIARFSGGLELLTRGEAVGLIRPSAELANITEWDLQETYRHLRLDLDASRIGFYAADLVHALLAEHDPHPAVFTGLCELLGSLVEPAGRATKLLAFQWLLLDECGYRPSLEAEPVGRGAYLFDPQAGGLTDQPTRPPNDDRGPWRVRRQTVELLQCLADDQPIDEDEKAIERANRLLCVYIRTIIDRQLPTMSMLLTPPTPLTRHERA